MEVTFGVEVLAIASAIAFVIGICFGSWLQGQLALKEARELIAQTARRRKNISSNESNTARELDLVIASVARKFLPEEEKRGWLAVAGEEDPR